MTHLGTITMLEKVLTFAVFEKPSLGNVRKIAVN